MNAQTELRNAATMRNAQNAYDSQAQPDEPDDYTMLLPIGDAEVLVVYIVYRGSVTITGAYIGADFVDVYEFAQGRRAAWEATVQAQVDKDLSDAADYNDAGE